jgi:hypothetical protein
MRACKFGRNRRTFKACCIAQHVTQLTTSEKGFVDSSLRSWIYSAQINDSLSGVNSGVEQSLQLEGSMRALRNRDGQSSLSSFNATIKGNLQYSECCLGVIVRIQADNFNLSRGRLQNT